MSTIQNHRSATPFVLWLGYVAFVIYGSLVPLQYKARSMDSAIAAFQQIPFLTLGIESRADWISNGVLYVPVGILTVLALRAVWPRLATMLALPIALIFCAALAIGVEFTQLFFPPRTVSQNDLMAELIGSVIGLVWVTRFSAWFASVFNSLLQDSQRLFHLALDAYFVAYLAFALFPFDFLLSADEIANKANSNLWGWLLAGSGNRASIVVLRLTAEIALTLPLGWWLARGVRERAARRRAHRQLHRRSPESISHGQSPNHASHSHSHPPRVNYGLTVAFGLALGLLLEITQFFIASGTSQGLSVLTRLFGVVAGAVLSQYAIGWKLEDAARLIRRFFWLLLLSYLLALLEVNGWLSTQWQGVDYAAEQWGKVNFMPFYYHYFTTEAVALFSLSAVFFSYLPMGVLCWAYRVNTAVAVLSAMLVATLIETGKLFIQGMHPDPTNALIASAAIWLTLAVLRLAANPRTMAATSPGAPGPVITQPGSQSPTQVVVLAAVCAAALLWAVTLPGAPVLASGVLLAAGVVVWFKPLWAFGIISAALPVFDLAPLTGRFYFDEFDVLIALTLCIAFAKAPAAKPTQAGRTKRRFAASDPWPAAVAILFGITLAISTIVGLSPWQWPDLNAFNSYFSPYNALRIAKGAVWACLFWWLAKRFSGLGIDPRRPFAWGMAGGLALTVIVIIWERLAFPGLWVFSSDYRVTGPFSATHTGGAYIDCFIAAAIPFLIVLTLEQRHWLVKIAGLGLILASTYALVVTFSRGGYLAYAVAVAVVMLALVLTVVLKSTRKLRHSLVLVGLALAMLLVALPVFMSNFMQARLVSANADFDFRTAHWADALAIRDPDLMTSLFGMGVGRFPETKYWRSTLHPKVATYRLLSEQKEGRDNTFLRLDAGESIGLEQFVAIEPGQKYWLKFDVRPSHANTQVTIPICEKWLLTSFQCVNPSIDLGAQKASWRSVELQVDTRDFARRAWPSGRPVKLSLTHSLANSTLDFDNLHLLDENGAELLRNGDFAHGLDHWFFSIVGTLHAHWRTHNLFVATLFDQGWFGLVALVALLGLASVRAAKGVWQGNVIAAGSLAALCGFVVGGLFDTQIDAPRFLLLLLLLVWASFVPDVRSNGAKDSRGDRGEGLPSP